MFEWIHTRSKIPQASVRLWQIFLECVRNLSEDYVENGYVRKLQEYIRSHYINGFTAEEIEEACGLSYKYAGILFKETIGQTIREYQRTLRIRRAKQLLEETDTSVTEIAQMTGFSDVFYFSKVCVRSRGVLPVSTAGHIFRESKKHIFRKIIQIEQKIIYFNAISFRI